MIPALGPDPNVAGTSVLEVEGPLWLQQTVTCQFAQTGQSTIDKWWQLCTSSLAATPSTSKPAQGVGEWRGWAEQGREERNGLIKAGKLAVSVAAVLPISYPSSWSCLQIPRNPGLLLPSCG